MQKPSKYTKKPQQVVRHRLLRPIMFHTTQSLQNHNSSQHSKHRANLNWQARAQTTPNADGESTTGPCHTGDAKRSCHARARWWLRAKRTADNDG